MKRKFIVFLLVSAFMLKAAAQGENNNWFLGSGHYITFNGGSPAISADVQAGGGLASISDAGGNLLFYTDGHEVYNKNNMLMPGGAAINATAGQCIVVPDPASSTRYYVFRSDNDLRYGKVDMTLDGGLGDVTVQNVLVSNDIQYITATRHRDGSYFWIVGKSIQFGMFEDLRSFLISATGVGSAVVSPAIIATNGGLSGGVVKISNDGCRLLQTETGSFDFPQRNIALYRFNNYSGAISDGSQAATASFPGAGAFSPDNSKLYIGSQIIRNFNAADSGSAQPLMQYDLAAGDASQVLATATAASAAFHSVYAVEPAPDGKIYFARITEGLPATYAARLADSQQSLGAIEDPSSPGLSSNVNATEIASSLLSVNKRLPSFFNLTYTGALSLCSSVFAVTSISITGNVVNKNAVLRWSVENDADISSFDAELSHDGAVFSRIGTVINPQAPGIVHTYQFTDSLFPSYTSKTFYRIRENKIGGGSAFSAIISLDAGNDHDIAVYPNPFANDFRVQLKNGSIPGKIFSCALYDPAGKLIIKKAADNNGTVYFDNLQHLAAGVYMVQAVTADGSFFSRVIKR